MSDENERANDEHETLLLLASAVRLMTGVSSEILFAVRRAKTESGADLKRSLNEIENYASKSIMDLLGEIEAKRAKIGVPPPPRKRRAPKAEAETKDD